MSGYDGLNPEFSRRLQAMIAASGGLLAPGSGFRSIEEQIELRKTNGCPDVWSSPASSCRIPTAIPGLSNHNRGLADDLIDTSTGKAVKTGSAADAWLAAHAGEFGLHRPVGTPGEKGWEPWHVEMTDDDGSRDAMNSAMSDGAMGFDTQKMNEPRNPQDELADRMHAVMRILGSSTQPIDDPHALEDPYGVGGEDIPAADQMGADTTTLPNEMGTTPAATGGAAAMSQDAAGYQSYAKSQLKQYGWDDSQMGALVDLWNRESGWNPNAQNPTSTAYGIAQFLNGTWAGTGIEKTSDPSQQIQAGLTYIKARYGSPQAALAFWNRHRWY